MSHVYTHLILGQRSSSQSHKVQKHISGDRVAGVSLHSIECPAYSLLIKGMLLKIINEKNLKDNQQSRTCVVIGNADMFIFECGSSLVHRAAAAPRRGQLKNQPRSMRAEKSWWYWIMYHRLNTSDSDRHDDSIREVSGFSEYRSVSVPRFRQTFGGHLQWFVWKASFRRSADMTRDIKCEKWWQTRQFWENCNALTCYLFDGICFRFHLWVTGIPDDVCNGVLSDRQTDRQTDTAHHFIMEVGT